MEPGPVGGADEDVPTLRRIPAEVAYVQDRAVPSRIRGVARVGGRDAGEQREQERCEQTPDPHEWFMPEETVGKRGAAQGRFMNHSVNPEQRPSPSKRSR